MHLVMTGIGAVIMLGICGLSSFFVIADEQRGWGAPDTGAAPAAAVAPPAISSRQIDPEPLSLAEVFSAPEIRPHADAAPYRVTLKHIDSECGTATTGSLHRVFRSTGCNQVVRAALIAPHGGYEVTAGAFNLTDAAAAAEAGRQVRPMVEAGAGSFASMAAGAAPGMDPVPRLDAQVAWRDRGHFLLYAVITRPDGATLAPDDPHAERITRELVDTYLIDDVIDARAAPS